MTEESRARKKSARRPNDASAALRAALDLMLEQALARPYATAHGKMCVPRLPEKERPDD